ncbi:MAG: sigma-54-dependent Fis family transcriptional regulator [candidate division Zixibacteria bacterium]|nr:sigma-54-dependent Fis family transcriptional regulator [candidate division Zixibacteria bacterium]
MNNNLNNKLPRILLVDDDLAFRKTVEITLKRNNYDVITAVGVKEAANILQNNKVELIITDLKMNDGTGIELLRQAKDIYPEVAVIIQTAYGSIKNAVDAMRQGAYDYIAKPFKNEELLILVERALENKNMIEELNVLREEIAWKYGFDSLVGVSPAMEQLKHLANRVAATDIAVLITGDSGTGKEVLSKAIHYHSDRRKHKFITIECTSIPENLLESEFFGHIKGSFTSAYNTRKGLFEEADLGTIFLDEVGDMPLALQAKILRVIQESEIRPVGSTTSKKIDVRIIAATNRDLGAMVKEGTFREDLYYRLNVLPIKISPLRERTDDIPVLTEHFLRLENLKVEGTQITITSEAVEKLLTHHWPGNVRELENTIKRAIALSQNRRIHSRDIIFITSKQVSEAGDSSLAVSNTTSGTLEDSLKQRIENSLSSNNWNFSKTASQLGIGRTTLWRKIKKYNIAKKEGLPIG